MKKHLLPRLVVIAVIALLTGCNTAGATTPPTSPTPTPVSTPILTGQTGGVLVDLPSFANLVDAVKPSVVSVNTEFTINSPFVQASVSGAGSGWIIDESGLIVTNNHVIEGATSISVELYDGFVYTPTSVQTDTVKDIAVLKINVGRPLAALRIGDSSKLRVGDWVVVVGNSLGLGISAKPGTISRLAVGIACPTGEECNNLIETDAAINPGNSGGPLFNLSGEVIGITSLKFSSSGVEGMGYAINIADALPVIQRLSK